MKAETLRNAVHAHGWLGLLISVPLFIVFWAGGLTLFHGEIQRWASVPHEPIVYSHSVSDITNLNDVVNGAIGPYDVDTDERLSLRLPSEETPYLKLFFRANVGEPLANDNNAASNNTTTDNSPSKASELAESEGSEVVKTESDGEQSQSPRKEKEFIVKTFNPHTGEEIFEDSPFELAGFLYELHYNLKLPQGLYIVGLITLFFFVLIFTGVVVQLKNLVKRFFMYRKDSTTRNKMNDLHNVVGVISLPYAAMYALTGLMFNLSLLLQIPAALLLYQGDIDALTKDAGFVTFTEKPSGNTLSMTNINDVVADLERKTGTAITSVNLHNWGDETAAYRLVGISDDGFATRVDRQYEVASHSYPARLNIAQDNVFAAGSSMLFSMHFASFAGVDLRFLFFVLALGVSGMIVAGNVLWFVKRQKHKTHPKTHRVMQSLTLGGCLGVIVATAAAFFLERTLAIEVSERHHLVEYAFGAILGAFVLLSFFVKDVKHVVTLSVIFIGLVLVFTFLADWLMFSSEMLSLWQLGDKAPLEIKRENALKVKRGGEGVLTRSFGVAQEINGAI